MNQSVVIVALLGAIAASSCKKKAAAPAFTCRDALANVTRLFQSGPPTSDHIAHCEAKGMSPEVLQCVAQAKDKETFARCVPAPPKGSGSASR